MKDAAAFIVGFASLTALFVGGGMLLAFFTSGDGFALRLALPLLVAAWLLSLVGERL